MNELAKMTMSAPFNIVPFNYMIDPIAKQGMGNRYQG
jgi:hypothetical protein